MKHILLTTVLSTFLLFFSVTPALAQYVQSGGVITTPQGKQALIDKKILNPQNNQFVDNLNIEQHTFLPDQDVIFRISITNVISSDIQNLVVTDKLPDVVNFVSASFGSYDGSSKILSLKIDTLKVGESKTFEIKTKIKGASQLSNTVTCQANLGRVIVNNISDEDTATFCVSQQVLGTNTALPATGPTQTLSLILLSFLFLTIGLLSKRIIFLERG